MPTPDLRPLSLLDRWRATVETAKHNFATHLARGGLVADFPDRDLLPSSLERQAATGQALQAIQDLALSAAPTPSQPGQPGRFARPRGGRRIARTPPNALSTRQASLPPSQRLDALNTPLRHLKRESRRASAPPAPGGPKPPGSAWRTTMRDVTQPGAPDPLRETRGMRQRAFDPEATGAIDPAGVLDLQAWLAASKSPAQRAARLAELRTFVTAAAASPALRTQGKDVSPDPSSPGQYDQDLLAVAREVQLGLQGRPDWRGQGLTPGMTHSGWFSTRNPSPHPANAEFERDAATIGEAFMPGLRNAAKRLAAGTSPKAAALQGSLLAAIADKKREAGGSNPLRYLSGPPLDEETPDQLNALRPRIYSRDDSDFPDSRLPTDANILGHQVWAPRRMPSTLYGEGRTRKDILKSGLSPARQRSEPATDERGLRPDQLREMPPSGTWAKPRFGRKLKDDGTTTLGYTAAHSATSIDWKSRSAVVDIRETGPTFSTGKDWHFRNPLYDPATGKRVTKGIYRGEAEKAPEVRQVLQQASQALQKSKTMQLALRDRKTMDAVAAKPTPALDGLPASARRQVLRAVLGGSIQSLPSHLHEPALNLAGHIASSGVDKARGTRFFAQKWPIGTETTDRANRLVVRLRNLPPRAR